MSIIFYHDEKQKNAALKSIKAVEEKLGGKVNTELLPYTEFYLAEDYHQKYYLQNIAQLADEIISYYADFRGFIDSTAAARLNGLAAGYGDPGLLALELDSYGLSPQAKELLLKMLK